MTRRSSVVLLSSMAAASLMAVAGAPASAQTVPAAGAPVATAPSRSTGIPQRDTLIKMTKPVSNVEFKEHRLEDVMRYVADVSQADMEVFWQDDRNSVGLDKEMPITLKQDRGTVLDLLDKVLEKAQADATGTGGNAWQLTEAGTLQIGPKERLNKYKYVKLYSISDMLLEVPNYTNAPEFDLQSVLQQTGQGGGGGGGQSPFRDNQQQNTARKPLEDRAKELMDVIAQLVEQEQWVDNGGDGASMRFFQGSLIVNAPDYIHRQIDGYPFWPASATRVSMVGGRRYVSIGVDTTFNKIDGFTPQPVTAVVGGNLVSSDPNNQPGGTTDQGDKPANPKK